MKQWYALYVLLCSYETISSRPPVLSPESWRHRMKTFSALMAFCAGSSPVIGEFSSQRRVTRSFDAFFDLCLNERLSTQSRCWWFETLSRSFWRHCKFLQVMSYNNLRNEVLWYGLGCVVGVGGWVCTGFTLSVHRLSVPLSVTQINVQTFTQFFSSDFQGAMC